MYGWKPPFRVTAAMGSTSAVRWWPRQRLLIRRQSGVQGGRGELLSRVAGRGSSSVRNASRPRLLSAKTNNECQLKSELIHFSGDQVLSCEGTGTTPIVPETLTSSVTKRGFFPRHCRAWRALADAAALRRLNRKVLSRPVTARARASAAGDSILKFRCCPNRSQSRRSQGRSQQLGITA